jgi:NADH-quinone oxidoreductase subunit E
MRQKTKDTPSQIKDILSKHSAGQAGLIPVLQDVQERFGYLSQAALAELERQTDISANEIYGVASFYTQFRFTPPGEHTMHVCQGTACHVRGARQILTEIERRLGIKAGQTTKDGKFDLERVACLGCCALAPVVAVDGRIHGAVTAAKAAAIISQYQKEGGNR